jgi:hypothetical protein
MKKTEAEHLVRLSDYSNNLKLSETILINLYINIVDIFFRNNTL